MQGRDSSFSGRADRVLVTKESVWNRSSAGPVDIYLKLSLDVLQT